MRLASWNVNSIRARQERVLAWLDAKRPDVLCMQELKVEEKDFPAEAFEALGYRVVRACQKTYNGVAIAARVEISDVVSGLDDGEDDPQQRLIAGTVDGVRILSAYVPNGQAVGTDKYVYKLKWLKRLRAYLERRCDRDAPLVLCGDFNVAPDERDVHAPAEWLDSTLFHPEVRAALEEVRTWGLVDTFRQLHAEPGFYSWWDYRMLGFPKNRGLRIDHVFATETLARRCVEASIDREARKGKLPSDHAPVLATFT